MSALKLLAIASVVTAISLPALAQATMMKKGEVMMMTPDGKMATMSMNKDMMATMMKDGKPIDHCLITMMGDDGKMMMMQDMKMSNGMMACNEMMKK